MIITTPNKYFKIYLSCTEVGLCQTRTFLCFFKTCRMNPPSLCFLPLQANLRMCRMLCSKRAQPVMTRLQFKRSASQQRTTNPPGLLLQKARTLSGLPSTQPAGRSSEAERRGLGSGRLHEVPLELFT